MPDSPLVRIIVSLPAFLLAIVLHEVAHGYVAYLLGDDTAKRAGRLTLSPIAHLDPIGTIFFLFSSWMWMGFGWARPVPVMIERLRNPRRDEVLVTLAGPGANLLQAIAWAVLLRVAIPFAGSTLGYALVNFCLLGVGINVLLLLFNLLPIPPLDGSHVAARLLGFDQPGLIERLAPIGFLVLVVFLSSGLFQVFSAKLFYPVLGLFLPRGF